MVHLWTLKTPVPCRCSRCIHSRTVRGVASVCRCLIYRIPSVHHTFPLFSPSVCRIPLLFYLYLSISHTLLVGPSFQEQNLSLSDLSMRLSLDMKLPETARAQRTIGPGFVWGKERSSDDERRREGRRGASVSGCDWILSMCMHAHKVIRRMCCSVCCTSRRWQAWPCPDDRAGRWERKREVWAGGSVVCLGNVLRALACRISQPNVRTRSGRESVSVRFTSQMMLCAHTCTTHMTVNQTQALSYSLMLSVHPTTTITTFTTPPTPHINTCLLTWAV